MNMNRGLGSLSKGLLGLFLFLLLAMGTAGCGEKKSLSPDPRSGGGLADPRTTPGTVTVTSDLAVDTIVALDSDGFTEHIVSSVVGPYTFTNVPIGTRRLRITVIADAICTSPPPMVEEVFDVTAEELECVSIIGPCPGVVFKVTGNCTTCP